MSSVRNEVANKALNLSPADRAKLAHDLIVRLDRGNSKSTFNVKLNFQIQHKIHTIGLFELRDTKLFEQGLDNTSFKNVLNDEIERRVEEIKNGKAKGRPAEEVLAEIKAKYS